MDKIARHRSPPARDNLHRKQEFAREYSCGPGLFGIGGLSYRSAESNITFIREMSRMSFRTRFLSCALGIIFLGVLCVMPAWAGTALSQKQVDANAAGTRGQFDVVGNTGPWGNPTASPWI
jgi:hypothetical protein